MFAALLLVLIGAAWIACAPIEFGGQTAYVIVNGISMEPGMHSGDLAILRQAPDYLVGDVVTYRHPQIGPVIHRIIALDGDRFVFKGDNNTWIDSYQPTRAECIGKLWIYVPSAGSVLEQLRIPRNMALLAAVLGVMVMATVTSGPDQHQWRPQGRSPLLTVRLVFSGREGQRQPRRGRQLGERSRAMDYAGTSREAVFFVLAVLAFVSLLLGAFAFTRPTSLTVADDITYEQIGEFSYSAAAPPGVYDTGGVQTGDPVFRNLTSAVTVDFIYRLAADRPTDLRGTYRLTAEVSDISGWKRRIELQPETTFSGGTFTASRGVDLARVQALIDSFEKQTALVRPQYTLAVVPEIIIQGSLAGQDLRDEFAPRLEFQFDKLQMQFAKDGSRATDPLKPLQKGLLKHSTTQPNTLALLGLTLEITTARTLAMAGLALAVSGLLLFGLLMSGAAQGDVAVRIKLKYGPLLIAIRESELGASGRVVDVATIEDLAKLAEQTGHMILHTESGAAHRYFVHDGDMIYRYEIGSREEAALATAENGVR
jgi:signal peptidase I